MPVLRGAIAHLRGDRAGANRSLRAEAHFESMFGWAVEVGTPGSSFAELEERGKRHWRDRNFAAPLVDIYSAVR